ncbi:hypothetical protein LX83_005966 [Goodfellowiella coeruleoviolacea]|uniref:MftR C-terminal domain-containing protein n=1 Tax=Goodfellowiella coeruleoviolacea TaxID=334858 RepID=A0AAE3GIZ4_9PSEU|nr:hypothetical protein [Goodfellowiella coeruleoviolacea]
MLPLLCRVVDQAPNAHYPVTAVAPDPDPEFRRTAELVVATPALRAYARALWTDCEAALTRVIAEETGRDADDLSLRLLARYVLEIPDLAGTPPDPRAAMDTAFAHLRHGWPGL